MSSNFSYFIYSCVVFTRFTLYPSYIHSFIQPFVDSTAHVILKTGKYIISRVILWISPDTCLSLLLLINKLLGHDFLFDSRLRLINRQ